MNELAGPLFSLKPPQLKVEVQLLKNEGAYINQPLFLWGSITGDIVFHQQHLSLTPETAESEHDETAKQSRCKYKQDQRN